MLSIRPFLPLPHTLFLLQGQENCLPEVALQIAQIKEAIFHGILGEFKGVVGVNDAGHIMRVGEQPDGFIGELCLGRIREKVDALIERQSAMIRWKFSMEDDERLVGGQSGIYLLGLFCFDKVGG